MATKTPKQLENEIKSSISTSTPETPDWSSRDSYPNDLLPGDLVQRRDIKGRKKYRVSHTGRSGGYVQVYAREVGGGSGQIVSFDRSQLRAAD